MSNPKDYCSQATKDSTQKEKLKKTSWIDKAKKVVDKVLSANKMVNGYLNAGYSASNTNYNSVNNQRIAYDLNVLSDNEEDPFYIYYRDDTEYMWKRNYSYSNNYIRSNIELIHYNIVFPIRQKINDMFGDKVSVNVEYCYLCESSLEEKRLDRNHLFNSAKAVMLNITGERASTIYQFIMNWTRDDADYDPAFDEDEEIKPINYGLMKLCDVYEKDEFQRLYITLPFTEAELKLDELLVHNKSNFYYTPTNALLMAPEANTSTKIFPKYVEDNNVEDGFNKLDDIDDEIEKLENEITEAKDDQDATNLDRLTNELNRLEKDKEYIHNPNNSLSEIDLNIKKAQELYDSDPNDYNKSLLDSAKDELDKYPTLNDTLPDYITKLNALDVIIYDELDITDDKLYINYWKARKLVALKIAIMNREQEVFNITEEELNNIFQRELTIYESVRKERYNTIYNNKINALYPDGNIPADTIIPYIEVTNDEINMDDIEEPTKDKIRENLENEFNTELAELQEIYNNIDIDRIDAIVKEYPLNKIPITDLEYNNIERIEYNKFDDLKELVKECDRYVLMDTARDTHKQFIEADVYINANEPRFNVFLDSKEDYDTIKDYYYNKLKESYKGTDNIDVKINNSINMVSIFKANNFDSTIIPALDTKEYGEYALKYIDCELELHKNNPDKVNEINQFKTNALLFIEDKEYDKIELDTIKTDIFNFGNIEYSSGKSKYLKDLYQDTTNPDMDSRIIAYIAYTISNDRAEIGGKNYYINLNTEIGHYSYNHQIISNILDPFYKDTNNAIDNIDTKGITAISNDLKDKIELFDTYLFQKVTTLNTYLTRYNEYMKYILYNEDMNVQINKLVKNSSRNHNFIDYGCENISLLEKAGNLLLNKEDDDRLYKIRLIEDRVMMKRQLSYTRLTETERKIIDYNMELAACIDFNKLNRFKEIKNKLLPELLKQKDLEKSFVPEDTMANILEKQKQLEKDRLLYLYNLDVTDIPLLYRHVTSDITIDYENNSGVFEYMDVGPNEKYIYYLQEVIKAIKAYNNAQLDKEIPFIEKEIAYIRNLNNEKKNKLVDLRQELAMKKAEIAKELNKRQTDNEYNYETTKSFEIEKRLKLKYKSYMRIDSLPSTGVTYRFPFLLYKEFKAVYDDIIKPKTKLSVYEYIDSYNQYSKIHYNLFEVTKHSFINDCHSKWLNIKYVPDIATMIQDNKYYTILLNDNMKDTNIHKEIVEVLPIISGVIDMDTILLTDNEIEFNSGLLVKCKRTLNGFKKDFNYLLKSIYGKSDTILGMITIRE